MSYPPPDLHRLAVFGGVEVKRWDPEPLPPKGQGAFDRFLALSPDALIPVALHVFAYYADMIEHLGGKERIAKVGQVDGHVTNASSYADPDLQDVVYHGMNPANTTYRRA